jgi:hemin uptake protein HemP
MNENQQSQPPLPQSQEQHAQPRVINATQLFQGNREVVIELDGIRYRLRITRRSKLILQK